jgi:acetylornithine deacetylase/succinyl-diaminopimelate desuccinylase-like protein
MDWNQLLQEATYYLQEYIRMDTSNPPGNETETARFFERIFERESIPCQIFESLPGRGNILATLKGSGTKGPLLLLSHMDVVPVEKEHWEVDPFAGTIRDGYLYGRGTLDDKSMGIVEAMALLILKREGVSLKRDLLFFATADEETGGRWGVEWAMEHLPSLSEAEYAINEGGHIILDDNGRTDRYEISNGQKVLFQLKLKARGTSGHASRPLPDNPNVRLVHALERITQWETPCHVLPTVKEFFQKLAPKQPPERRPFFEDIEKGLKDPAFFVWLMADPAYDVLLKDTVCLTVLQGGSKANVIPSESTSILDCRLLPGSSKENFLQEIKRRLGEEIDIEVISESDSLPPSPTDTELFRAIENFAGQNDPGCPVVPFLLAGATDSRFLREKGIVAYDLSPFRLTQKDLLLMHGNNERIAVENLRFGMKMMVDIIEEIAS